MACSNFLGTGGTHIIVSCCRVGSDLFWSAGENDIKGVGVASEITTTKVFIKTTLLGNLNELIFHLLSVLILTCFDDHAIF